MYYTSMYEQYHQARENIIGDEATMIFEKGRLLTSIFSLVAARIGIDVICCSFSFQSFQTGFGLYT